jgi:hypothetical protein
VDLPLSFVGPFQSLSVEQTPSGQRALVSSDRVGDLDEPSVVRLEGRRVVFATLTTRDAEGAEQRVIARAAERTSLPPGSLDFTAAQPFFLPELPWEQGAVASPSVVRVGDSALHMVYAAGGSIGLAHSPDGERFERRAMPILLPEAAHGEASALEAPSLARAPDGRWHLAYVSGGRIFAAHAAAPEGPWTRAGAILEPDANAAGPDGGAGFESHALGDPALSIETTAAGRPLFVLFYTADGGTAVTSIGAAASFDGVHYSRVGRPVYSERSNAVRAGSFEPVDARTALLWIGTASGRRRVISAAIGPTIPRVPPPPGR